MTGKSRGSLLPELVSQNLLGIHSAPGIKLGLGQRYRPCPWAQELEDGHALTPRTSHQNFLRVVSGLFPGAFISCTPTKCS